MRRAFTLDPLPPEHFVGRRDAILDILVRALNPVPVLEVIDGPSHIGRTSLLKRFASFDTPEAGGLPFALEARRLVTPYFDLGEPPAEGRRSEDLFYDGVAAALAGAGFPVQALAGKHDDRGTLVEKAAEDAVASGAAILLLIDRGEYYLSSDGWDGSAWQALSALNERARIAVSITFGPTGPAEHLDVDTRRARLEAVVYEMSSILDRSDATGTTLGLLSDEEVQEFAATASVPLLDGTPATVNETDVEWLTAVSGGHPYILQKAGVRLFELKAKGDRPEDREAVERQLAERGLHGFVRDAFHRIGPLDGELIEQIRALAIGETLDQAPVELVDEGFVDSQGRGAVMRSRVLRNAVSQHLDTLRGAAAKSRQIRPASTPRGTTDHALVLRATGEALPLSATESLLLARLFAAPEGEVVANQILQDEIGATKPHQVTQRLSVLRSKIDAKFAITDLLMNTYRKGYRLAHRERFDLT